MVTETDQTSEVSTEVTTEVSNDTDTTETTQGSDSAVAAKNTSSKDVSSGNAEKTEKPAFVPNYKLKVYDEEKELEDKFLKDLIKDAESEKKVKEIAQKYLGFDTVKGRHEKVKGEYQTYKTQTEPVVEYYNYAQDLLANKNYDDFFELIKLPKEEIFSWAVKKAQEAQMPAEDRARVEYQRQIERDRMNLEKQTQHLQMQQQQQLAQFRAQELDWVMQRPDVSTVAKAYDLKNGQGSFRMLVRDKGLAHFAATNGKEDLTAEQAVAEVMKVLSPFVNQTNAGATPGAGMAPQTPLIPQNGAPPIIPNAAGKGSSPVKKQYRSIADLKKRSEELQSSS